MPLCDSSTRIRTGLRCPPSNGLPSRRIATNALPSDFSAARILVHTLNLMFINIKKQVTVVYERTDTWVLILNISII